MTTQEIISAFATTNENGEVTSFDFDSFNALVDELVETRKQLKKEAKEAEKARIESEREVLAETGKKYYDSLAEGDEFEYKNSEGTVLKARKIKTKSNTGTTAACELLEFTTKTGKRYPKFYQVIVPAND
jgi:dsDNA-specific endonuclease/ATPase MutS2